MRRSHPPTASWKDSRTVSWQADQSHDITVNARTRSQSIAAIKRTHWGIKLESGSSTATGDTASTKRTRWLFPLLRVLFVFVVALLAWLVAANWNKWIGNARFQVTQDAFVAGDVTPLSAKVSGYVATVAVGDYQAVHKGDLIVEIEPSDYRAQLAFAEANLASARASLANLAHQRDVQRALVRQAEATIAAANADLIRSSLELTRQRRLLDTRIASTEQLVEQADATEKRANAQLELSKAELDQQNALLAGLDGQERLLAAQVKASEAQVGLAENNLRYTRVLAPAEGLVGQRQVRPGQFVNVGTQVIAIVPMPNLWVTANYKETQLTNIRMGQLAKVTVDAFPGVVLTGHVDSWSPGTGSIFALLPPDNATGNFTKVVQRVPVKIVLDANPALGELVRPGMSVQATIDTRSATEPRLSSAKASPQP
ncbi:HlyD family secretion protein [Phyllobacterium sp. BT25]|uniref:HlyD family secretion protein n=2 Tax=Phyllobacterium pellucidum TaxID=2740464 RepID=A0A849VHX6_9HYPH|nr:HlyD family secretion protein [Phyllobacterium pellucidum]